MMREKRNYVIVGGFTLIMLVALIVSVSLLTGHSGALESYQTRMTNVAGIKFGTKVSYEGFILGYVEDIQPELVDGRTEFVLKLGVREGWPIPADSIARIAAAGLLAAVSVDIKAGTSATMLKPGAEIPSGPAANIFSAMNQVAEQVAQLNQQGLMPLLATINHQAEALGSILQAALPKLVANLEVVTADLARNTPKITADLRKASTTLSGQMLSDRNVANVSDSFAHLAALTGGLQASQKSLDEVLTTLNANRTNIDAAVKDIHHILQAIAHNIDSLAYNLEATGRNANEFSREIRDNPGVLISGAKAGTDGPGR